MTVGELRKSLEWFDDSSEITVIGEGVCTSIADIDINKHKTGEKECIIGIEGNKTYERIAEKIVVLELLKKTIYVKKEILDLDKENLYKLYEIEVQIRVLREMLD